MENKEVIKEQVQDVSVTSPVGGEPSSVKEIETPVVKYREPKNPPPSNHRPVA